VDRYWKRKAFKPENFWNIALTLEKNREKSDFIWNRGRLYDRISCIALYEVCMENPIATIVSVEEKETRK
jgi:DNA topoisomerase-3